jgi:hypothetical protein
VRAKAKGIMMPETAAIPLLILGMCRLPPLAAAAVLLRQIRMGRYVKDATARRAAADRCVIAAVAVLK